jgi:hypothetical protein
MSTSLPITRVALAWAAGLVVVLNLLDALWTITFLEAGVADEANPLMVSALTHGPVGFMAFKLALVSLSVLLLWRLRRHRSAALALWSGAMAYAVVVAYHVSNAHHLMVAAR